MIQKRMTRAVASVLGALTPALAWASEAGGHGDSAPNLFSGDLGNSFWTLVIFVFVLVVLGKFAWGPILKMLQQREQFISNSLESAKRDRDDAKKMMADYSKKIEAAHQEASAIVDEARRDGEALRRKLHEDAEKEGREMLARAQRDIQIAKETAISELYSRTLDLAGDVAGKIIKQKVDGQGHKALLDESIAELSKAGRNN
ncbi:ATP synthase subunit b [Phycisphaerae bacterium RAS2]|nr:ATP synthase subunit b [Phycisphaerae bacterium RAS2]